MDNDEGVQGRPFLRKCSLRKGLNTGRHSREKLQAEESARTKRTEAQTSALVLWRNLRKKPVWVQKEHRKETKGMLGENRRSCPRTDWIELISFKELASGCYSKWEYIGDGGGRE